MDDLDARLSDLRTLPVGPLPGAAAARSRGDQRTRRARTVLAATAAVAAVLAVSVVPGLTAGDRITAPPAGPAPTAAPAPATLSLALLDTQDLSSVRSGTWSSAAPPDDPSPALPQGCGRSTATATLESARVVLTGSTTSVEQQVVGFATAASAQRELGLVVDAVEACEGGPWTLVGGLPGTGPDRVYGTWEQDGATAVFVLERFGAVLSTVAELSGQLDGLPLLADTAAAKLATFDDRTPAAPEQPAWDISSALLTAAEAATVEPGDWTAEPIVDQRVLDPCGALDIAPEGFSGSSLQVQREAGGTTVDTSVARFATPDAAEAALQSYRAAVLGCPLETRGESTSSYELLTDEVDRLVVREVAGCPECLPYPSYAVVVRDGTGLVTVRVAVGEDGDPGPGLAEQYGALAQDRLALVVPD